MIRGTPIIANIIVKESPAPITTSQNPANKLKPNAPLNPSFLTFDLSIITSFLSIAGHSFLIVMRDQIKRTATLDCLGPKQAVMPILFYVAAHFMAQLRDTSIAILIV